MDLHDDDDDDGDDALSDEETISKSLDGGFCDDDDLTSCDLDVHR